MARYSVASSLDVVLAPAHACPASLALAGVRAVCLRSRRVRCSCSCQCAVVLVASWSVRSALVACRCSGRLRSRICCVQVFCLLRCWLAPVAWGPHGTFVLCAVCPPWGRKVLTSGQTAVKNVFPDSVPFSLPRPGSVACTTHHPVSRGAL